MPPLNEGDILYMPTTLPGISITKAKELLQQTDKIIQSFPEVQHTLGKVGRAETATDPAPLSMIETTITLRPKVVREKMPVKRFFFLAGLFKRAVDLDVAGSSKGKIVQQWRKKKIERFFSGWPGWLKETLTWFCPKSDISPWKSFRRNGQGHPFPGADQRLDHADQDPDRHAFDRHQNTGGDQAHGTEPARLSDLGARTEAMVRQIPGTLSAYSERVTGGNYLDFTIRRDQIARYGLTVADVQDVIMTAIGGKNLTYTVEGLERYPVNLRYSRELRDNIDMLKGVLVAAPTGAQIPLAQLADISIHKGPAAIKSENSRPTAWIYVDLKGVDVGTYVENAKAMVSREIKLPVGYSMVWSGQYQYMQEARKKLNLVVPLTLTIIFVMLYMHFHNFSEAFLVMASLPLDAVVCLPLRQHMLESDRRVHVRRDPVANDPVIGTMLRPLGNRIG